MPESLKRVKYKLRLVYKRRDSLETLIRDLNPILRGWGNYYRISFHSAKYFTHINNYVYKSTINWLKKKHPQKSIKWLHSKYVYQFNNRTWRLGISQEHLIFDITLASILKLKILKSGINPYFNEAYYEKYYRIFVTEPFRELILKKQNNKCAACNKMFTNGWANWFPPS